MRMDLKALYCDRLDDAGRVAFCELAQTSDGYMRVHLVHRRRIPRPDLMGRLLNACQRVDPSITREQLLHFFYQDMATPVSDDSAGETRAAA